MSPFQEVHNFDPGSAPCLLESCTPAFFKVGDVVAAPASQERLRPLSALLGAEGVWRWDAGRFSVIRTIQAAPRNSGRVDEVIDTISGGRFAMKVMPNDWACSCHASFVRRHPGETERPWVDIVRLAFLEASSYPYSCRLQGVYRDEVATRVVTEFASGGDVFGWADRCPHSPGPAREAACLPLARQLLDAVRWLHDLGVVHRDISAENVLLSRQGRGEPQLRLIDFAMSTGRRHSRAGVRGKPAYLAPELHSGEACDGFLSDAFAAGVVLFLMLMKEYPCLSTMPGGCKAHAFFQRRGLQELVERRRRGRGEAAAGESTSGPLLALLEGLLEADPAARLTLGESPWLLEDPTRPSVWQEPWTWGSSGA